MTSGNGSRLGASPNNPTLGYSLPHGRVLAAKQTRDMASALEQSLHSLKISVTQLQTRAFCASYNRKLRFCNSEEGLHEVGRREEGKLFSDVIRDHLITRLFR